MNIVRDLEYFKPMQKDGYVEVVLPVAIKIFKACLRLNIYETENGYVISDDGEMNINCENFKEKIIYVEINQNEQNVLSVLKENGKLTLEEVSDKIGRSLRTVKSIIKSLIEKKKIERVGSKKSGYWKVL